MNLFIRKFIRKHPVIFWIIILCSLAQCEQRAHAGSFDCETDGSSVQQTNVYRACGIGEASLESQARLNAVKNARDEFNINCDQNCLSALSNIGMRPKRTVCKENPSGQWKCYHLVEYVLTMKKK